MKVATDRYFVNHRLREAGNSIPWSDVIRFHMDIVGRGEESFFSFSPDDEASERWAYAGESMMAERPEAFRYCGCPHARSSRRH